MEKEIGQVKVTETDQGFRIEVTGKSLGEMLKCCCMPVMCAPCSTAPGCCEPTDAKK